MEDILNLGGAQTNRGSVIRNVVGLGPVTLVAVNPNRKELEALLGKELNQDPNYTIQEDNLGNKTRPIALWFQSGDKLISERIYVSNRPITTKNGDKYKFINRVGQISYYVDSAETLMGNDKVKKWFNMEGLRKLNEGEHTLFNILQTFSRYDAKAEGANWMEVMTNIGCTAEKLYEGEYAGLRKFVDYLNSKNNMLIALHSIARRETEDGVRFNQRLVLREETIFSTVDGEVKEWMINRLNEANSKQIAAGYTLTNTDFKVCALEEYNPNEFDSAEDVPASTTSALLDL